MKNHPLSKEKQIIITVVYSQFLFLYVWAGSTKDFSWQFLHLSAWKWSLQWEVMEQQEPLSKLPYSLEQIWICLPTFFLSY